MPIPTQPGLPMPGGLGRWLRAALTGTLLFGGSLTALILLGIAGQLSPAAAMTLAASSTTTAPASSSFVLGFSNTDHALVTGNATDGSPSGTVTFYECGPSAGPTACTSKADEVGSAVAVTGGADDTASATSASFTPTSAGYWCLAGYYSGDSIYNASADTSTGECFDVDAAPTSTFTAPASSSIALGGSNTDGAAVNSNAAGVSPSGTVSFYECGRSAVPTACTSKADEVGSAVTVTAGAADTASATSASFTPTSTGYWCFAGYYSGDSNHSASADTSTDECFEVGTASASTFTTPASLSFVLGYSNTDHAVVTGNATGGSPTGAVSFYECGPSAGPRACMSKADEVGSATTVTAGAGDTASATSASFTPTSTGYWCFAGYYSGDSNYSASADTGADGCFDVMPAPTFHIATTSLPNTAPGTAYGPMTLQAANLGMSSSPYATTLKWKKVSLPKGLKMSKTGVLSGILSKHLKAGSSSITISATETVTTLNGTKKARTKTTVHATILLTIT